MTVVIDAMGAERGVYISVRGGLEALKSVDDQLLFVGDEVQIRRVLDQHATADIRSRTSVLQANENVSMGMRARDSLRLTESSIKIGIEAVAGLEDAAFVSAGNTGAILAHARVILGKINGIERPCLVSAIPTSPSLTFLSDAGANVDCKPFHLYQFALMTSLYLKDVYRIPHPKIAIISNGSERSKGNEKSRRAWELISANPALNFVGFIEGRELLQGGVDIGICDGFVGNIIIKTIEGVAIAMGIRTRETLRSSLLYSAGSFLAKDAWRNLKKSVDYSEFGGAPFLGVNGTVFVCHGNSNVNALKNAIIRASSLLKKKINQRIQVDLCC